MAAPAKPTITNPATGSTIHFFGSEKISVTVTCEASEQIIKVYIGGVLAGTMYTASGGTVVVPLIQLVAGSNVLTAKAMNLASELSAASTAVTVTGVDVSTSGDVDIISYLEDNIIDWLKANSTITALLAGSQSIYNREFPDTIEMFPALRIFNITEITERGLAGYSIGEVIFSIECVNFDLYAAENGVYGNTNYGDLFQGASDIINTVRAQIMTYWKSFIGELDDLECGEKNESDIEGPAGGYSITFSGIYRKPKQAQE